MGAFLSPFCTHPPGQHPHTQLASEMTFTGGYTDPLFANLHHGSNFHQSCPGQVQPFLQSHEFIMPWHYQMDRAQPQNPQFDHEMSVVYHQPGSPVSDADFIKLDEDNFHQLQQSTPAYFPPDYFLLSSPPILHSLFPSPDNFPSPIKEEYTDQASEDFMSPLPIIFESTGELIPQEMEDEGGGENGHQEPDPHCPGEISLATPTPAGDDTDCDKTAPYAVLIHRALMSTPRRRMVLAEIYQYFREKIPRFKKVKGRGWMNSIRHNLSMNGVSVPFYIAWYLISKNLAVGIPERRSSSWRHRQRIYLGSFGRSGKRGRQVYNKIPQEPAKFQKTSSG